VVQGGSETALIQAFKQPRRRDPLIALLLHAQWLFSELKLVQVHLPAYTEV